MPPKVFRVCDFHFQHTAAALSHRCTRTSCSPCIILVLCVCGCGYILYMHTCSALVVWYSLQYFIHRMEVIIRQFQPSMMNWWIVQSMHSFLERKRLLMQMEMVCVESVTSTRSWKCSSLQCLRLSTQPIMMRKWMSTGTFTDTLSCHFTPRVLNACHVLLCDTQRPLSGKIWSFHIIGQPGW